MVVLGLAGTAIFLLPFITELFYEPVRTALRVSNTQLGTLSSAYGLASLIGYPMGGWLADRIMPRWLIATALVGTGLGGLIFATFPPYPVALGIFVLWGAMTVVSWGALIRATREWASAAEQGRAFGALEGVRGVSEAGAYSGFLALFIWLGSTRLALNSVIIGYAATNVALGLATLIALRSGESHSAPAPRLRHEKQAGLAATLTNPAVWLIALVVMAGYTTYYGIIYFTPYGSTVLAMSVGLAGTIAAAKVWLKPIAAFVAGAVADRVGIWRAVIGCFAILIISFLLSATVSGGPGFATLMVINLAVASLAVFALRGIYFALLEECRIPAAETGTATGFVSMIGFTPDAFAPAVAGMLLDAYPGALGYRLFFALIAVIAAIGLLSALAIGRIVACPKRA